MAEQKNSPSSEDNQRKCSYCRRLVSKLNRYIENLDNEALKKSVIKRERANHFLCGAMGNYKTDNLNYSAECSSVPKAEVKCEDPIADDKMFQSEDTEKLLNREDMKKMLEEMMRKYPQMVAVKSEADDKGNFGGGFDIFCIECAAFFNDLELAQVHFEENLHD